MCIFWLKVSDKKLIHYNNSILNTVQFVGYRYYVLGVECKVAGYYTNCRQHQWPLKHKDSVPTTRLKNLCRIRGKTLIG